MLYFHGLAVTSSHAAHPERKRPSFSIFTVISQWSSGKGSTLNHWPDLTSFWDMAMTCGSLHRMTLDVLKPEEIDMAG